jgi:hypothetical protein
MLAADVIDRLIDFAGADKGGSAVDERHARRALQDALRIFPSLHTWEYYWSHGRINLNASYLTGTVAYVSSTRVLTLTGGTWPAWAAGGYVRIGDVIARVSSRDSNSQLTLDASLTFTDDIAAGTAYTLFQDTYDLPTDFLASERPIPEGWFGQMQYRHPADHIWMTRTADRSGKPLFYTFWPSTTPGRFALRISPYSDADETLDYLYRRRMAAVRYDLHQTGKVSIASASATVTGSGTAFRSDMIGSYLRVSINATDIPSGTEGNNPYVFQSKITAVASATSLTVADQATETLSGSAFVISDIIDLEEATMGTAFCKECIKHMAAAKRMKEKDSIAADAQKEIMRAREADSRNFAMEEALSGGVRRSWWKGPTGDDE